MNKRTRYLMAGTALLLGLSVALALLLAAPWSVRAAGTVRYAAPNGSTTGNCDGSWTNACTLQRALAVAVAGDEIWVKEGVHYPGSARTDTFSLKSNVALYGGFAGTETQRSQRNWQTRRTILSGDIDQNDITDGGVVTTTANIKGSNAYHVLRSTSIISTAVLDGFLITAGQANGSYPDDRGGGMYNNSSSPTLTNVTFSGNTADRGGGMYNDNSSPTLTNVTFSGNTATSYGGGMFNKNNSSPTLTNVTLIRNTSSNAGGMFNESYCNPTLMNVAFISNTATTDGGGMYNHIRSSPVLTNVTFSGNTAAKGGGIYNNNVCTPTLVNVIVWGNTATTGPEIQNTNSTPRISYSDIRGCGGSASWNSACGTNGGGNIDADPHFVNVAGGNLRLQPTSPCIDAGQNAAVPSGVTTDLDGRPRFADVPFVLDTGNGTPPIVDMGAYEAQYRYRVFLPLTVRNR